METWKRSFWTKRYSCGDSSFVIRRSGRTGNVRFWEGKNGYAFDIEYGDGKALFVMWPDKIQDLADPNRYVDHHVRASVASAFKRAIEEVHRKSVEVAQSGPSF